jgi:hypothetical protein
MRNLPFAILRIVLVAVALVSVLCITGCTSVADDSNHVSTRPWNTPKSWEGGMPSGMNEGR